MVRGVGKQIFDAVRHRHVDKFMLFEEAYEEAYFDPANMLLAGEAPCSCSLILTFSTLRARYIFSLKLLLGACGSMPFSP